MILGLECPSKGQVLIDGENICVMREKQKQEVRKRMGMVFQDGALFDSMTVGENVAYYLLEHTNLTWDEVATRARTMLGFVGLEPSEVINKLPENLSGGQRRRVAIGRALLSTDPKIMLYDEPTTGLDPAMTENVLDLMMKLKREKGISSIVVTHQVADAFSIADRYVVIWEGRVAFDGTFDELRDSKDLPVLQFLAPFRLSFAAAAKRNFVITDRKQ